MARFSILLFAALALAGSDRALGQCQEPTQVIRDTAEGLGYDVAIEGDVMAVTRHEKFADMSLQIYEHDGAGWRLAQEFVLAGGYGVDYEPAVDISGDHIVMGAANSRGDVWIFAREGGAWRLSQTIKFLAPGWPRTFGNEVAIDGDTLMISEYHIDTVHIYEFNGVEWRPIGALLSPDPEIAQFGRGIALDGDVAAILGRRGALNEAMIFRRTGGEWALEASLATALATGSRGRPIDVEGDTMVVAAGNPDLAHVYEYDGSGWRMAAHLAGPHRYLPPSKYFGMSVVLNNGRALVISSEYDGDLGRWSAGRLYEQAGGQWRLQRRLLHNDTKSWDFGMAAELHGRHAVLTAPELGSDPFSPYTSIGILYAFNLDAVPASCPVPPSNPDNGLRLKVSGILSPQTPEVTVTMDGFFLATEPYMAFARTHTSVEGSEPGWSAPSVLLEAYGEKIPGVIVGPRVDRIIASQDAGRYTRPPSANPIDIWQAEFRVDEFAPRIVTLRTDTRRFEVWGSPLSFQEPYLESRIAGMPEAEARIRVWRSSCLGDCDGSGGLDVLDFVCFQGLVAAGNLAADLDDDGELTIFDFLAFQDAFAAGCR